MMEPKYKAFISYHHKFDAQLASALQLSLSRFAKPWYRLRTMRVFRDETSMAPNAALWRSIEQALSEAEYFVLLACPLSATSWWVQEEIHWWVQHRSAETLLLCLTEGAILWDRRAGDFDWEHTTALPACLKGVFSAEPLWADFRVAKAAGRYVNSDAAYRAAVLNVAAPLMGRRKDDLDSEDIRLHRRARRTAWIVAGLMVVLGIVAAVSMQRATQRQKIAASRALASEAASPLEDRSLALLLSLESRRIADTVESRRSLLAALQHVSHAEVFLWGHTESL